MSSATLVHVHVHVTKARPGASSLQNFYGRATDEMLPLAPRGVRGSKTVLHSPTHTQLTKNKFYEVKLVVYPQSRADFIDILTQNTSQKHPKTPKNGRKIYFG
jgi:hypothetical protein